MPSIILCSLCGQYKELAASVYGLTLCAGCYKRYSKKQELLRKLRIL